MLFPVENHLSCSQLSSVVCSSLCRDEVLWHFFCPLWHCPLFICVIPVQLFMWKLYTLSNKTPFSCAFKGQNWQHVPGGVPCGPCPPAPTGLSPGHGWSILPGLLHHFQALQTTQSLHLSIIAMLIYAIKFLFDFTLYLYLYHVYIFKSMQ